MNILACRGITLMVCDMAGTVINEGGLVYKTLYETLKNNNIPVKKSDINDWHGQQKQQVISDMIDKYLPHEMYKNDVKNYCYDEFHVCLSDAYFGAHSNISLIDPELPNFFQRLQFNGVKIALNTGYERNFQRKIINHFNMNDYVDDFISSGDVRMGRPYPYMIHRIMERNNIISVKHVAKVGDTRNDVLEGKNAGCGITIAVQTGAGSTRDFLEADMIVDKITNIDMVVDDGFFL
jgi:phosphonatase-like hydrolase